MLWREAYVTEVVRGFSPPGPLAGVSLEGNAFAPGDWDGVILASGERGPIAAEGWRRLCEGDAPQARVAIGMVGTPGLADLVPRSRWGRTFALSGEGWAGVLDGRVAAWCPGAALLMRGSATEEAWDEFRAALLGQRGSPV